MENIYFVLMGTFFGFFILWLIEDIVRTYRRRSVFISTFGIKEELEKVVAESGLNARVSFVKLEELDRYLGKSVEGIFLIAGVRDQLMDDLKSNIYDVISAHLHKCGQTRSVCGATFTVSTVFYTFDRFAKNYDNKNICLTIGYHFPLKESV